MGKLMGGVMRILGGEVGGEIEDEETIKREVRMRKGPSEIGNEYW